MSKFDKYNLLISEIEPIGSPGNLGDSCAETSRYMILSYTGEDFKPERLKLFRTDLGYIRHPDSIWREDDFSSDQLIPLYAALKLNKQIPECIEILHRLTDNNFRTDNGTFISPLFECVSNSTATAHLPLLFQALAFWFPFRWNDGKKKITWEPFGAPADYLNYICILYFAFLTHNETWISRLAVKLTPNVWQRKVEEYYQPEPNSDFIKKLYHLAIFNILDVASEVQT